MYPSIQAKIWGNIGKVADLLDMVLDSFIKVELLSKYESVLSFTKSDFEIQ